MIAFGYSLTCSEGTNVLKEDLKWMPFPYPSSQTLGTLMIHKTISMDISNLFLLRSFDLLKKKKKCYQGDNDFVLLFSPQSHLFSSLKNVDHGY